MNRRSLWAARRTRGFTLVELMVVVAVLAVMATLAGPAVKDMAVTARLNADSGRLIASAQWARSEAIKRNLPVTLCASTDGQTCATGGGAQVWSSGWLVGFTPPGGSWTVLQVEGAAASGHRLEATGAGSAALYSLVFQPTGVGATVATVTMCRNQPAGNLQQRRVTVSATGRTQTDKTPRTEACPT